MRVFRINNPADRVLPVRHISARVPWHDQKWNGKTCCDVVDNSFCRILPLVDLKKDPESERPDEPINDSNLPPCVSEKGTFLSGTGFTRLLRHRYQELGNPLFKDFRPCKYDHKPFSFNAVPFAWLMKSTAKPNVNYDPDDRPHKSVKAQQFEVNYKPELEEVIDPKLGFEGNIWVQSAENQKALLDTFFGCLQKQKSLVFFYAKHTPLSEANERVIVGVAKVASNPGPILEYEFPNNYSGHASHPWDRCVEHTLRPDGSGKGVLLPYHEILEFTRSNNSEVDLGEFIAKAPDFAQFSYASELVEHDTAIDALLNVSEALRRANALLGRSFQPEIEWIDAEISKIWDMRGAFPGLGSVLSGIGVQNGNSIAWEIERYILGRDGDLLQQDPWEIFEASLYDPERFLGSRGRHLFIPATKTKWESKPDDKKQLYKFLSRCQLTNEQAEHLISEYDRKAQDVMENPYVLYEGSRFNVNGASFSTIDKAVFPPSNIIEAFPLPEGVHFDDQLDPRRTRSLSVLLLEAAASGEGHSLLPFDDLLDRLSEKQLSEPFPIDEDTLESQSNTDFFAEEVGLIPESENNPTRFLKLKRLSDIKTGILRRINQDVLQQQLDVDCDWLEQVIAHFEPITDEPGSAAFQNELEARYEKAEALRVLARSRVTILIGPAGSGKTEVLKILKKLPNIGSFLELAPTGKARVNLSPKALTLAQFLLKYGRYDTVTGCYSAQPTLQRYSGARNIVVDECSMLTEEQLSALLDALGPIDRLVLVGDHRQLPPIGTGRPFFDLASQFMPVEGSDASPIAEEGSFKPLTGPGYAELTKIKRQSDFANNRLDVQLSRCFTDKAAKEDLEVFWALSEVETNTKNLRLEKWYGSDDFRETFRNVVEEELDMKGHPDLEKRFNEILGAVSSGGHQYFNIGAEKTIENWQVLSPVNGHAYGVKEINKYFQTRYRKKAVDFALGRQTSIARPAGSDSVVYGDKVINLRNASWMDWQDIMPRGAKAGALNYIANGEIGIITGEFRPRNFNNQSKPNVEIAFSTQPGYSYVFRQSDLGEDSRYSVELAYAITIHKAQGSGFDLVFVVLPSKEAIISREMIYTALTRQKTKVIILHQGDFRDFARFASTEASATAKRFTDLFYLPEVRQIERKWYDAKYVNVSDRGERMISKNEVIIANLLNKYQDQIIYSYEDKLRFQETGRTVRPDFVIENFISNRVFHWEHIGMMTLRNYREKWLAKLEAYKNDGFVLHSEADASSAKVLIVTEENPNGGIDSQYIDHLIHSIIL